MAYILDILVIIIFLLSVWAGYRRGFFKSVIQLVGCIGAVLIASGLSMPFAEGIYDSFISKKVEQRIESQINKTGGKSVEETLEGVLGGLPESVTNALSLFELGTPEQIKDKVSNSLDGSVKQLSNEIEGKVVRPASVSLLRILCFFILFTVLMFLVRVVSNFIGRLFRFPILRQTDGLLGSVLGAVQGVVLVFVAVTVMSFIASISAGDDKLTRATINNTVIVDAVEEANPMTDKLYSMFGADSV